jgi:hypothetical protein
MIARAEKLGVAGKYIEFTRHVVQAARQAADRPVDLDMLGATGATMMDLGFTPEATWAILAVTRSLPPAPTTSKKWNARARPGWGSS